MEKRYQIFVSSTYADLKQERQKVIQTLMEMDCIPSGMELFPAADEEQWEFIKKIIDDCDYYLLIIGGRYGSTTPVGISYTEKEYDYAIERGIKVIALLHANPDEIPSGKTELDPDLRERLKSFREKVSTNRLFKPWKDANELPGLVALSLQKTLKTYPAVGWIRADKGTSEELGRSIKEFGILKVYPNSSSYISEYPIKSFSDSLNEGSEIFVFGRNLMYGAGHFDETYRRALKRGICLNFICHDPNDFSEFIKYVSELNPDESLTSINKFRDFIEWMESKRPSGRLVLKFYKGDMLDSIFCIKEDQKVTHLSMELSFGKTREHDKRVFLIDPEMLFGKDIQKRYLDKIFKFSSTIVEYEGRKFAIKRL